MKTFVKTKSAFLPDVASGGASDWALGVAQVPYSYSMELRDTGRYLYHPTTYNFHLLFFFRYGFLLYDHYCETAPIGRYHIPSLIVRSYNLP